MFYPRGMARTDLFDLGALRLVAGEGRRLEIEVLPGAFVFAGTMYAATPPAVPAILDISKMTHGGYALRLRFEATLQGPCMRCLEPAAPTFAVDAREVDQPGGGDELASPYVHGEELDVQAWAHDALGLALPVQILCRPDCLGLCPECGANRNEDPDHTHGPAKDPRWSALDRITFD